MPGRTNIYPQLIPANWSLSYIMMQNNNVQFFANSIMPLFPLFTSLLFLDLYKRKKNIINIMALIIYGIVILCFSSEFIRTGLVDTAFSFFLFLTIYSVQNVEDNNLDTKNLILITCSACAAAITKQLGLLILTFSFIWISWLLIKNRKDLALKDIFKKISILFFIIISTLSWYLIKIFEIKKGSEVLDIFFVSQDFHQGRSYLQRLLNGMSHFGGGVILLYFLLFLILVSLFNKKSRWFSICLTLPLILLWGFFFSYDERNLIAAYPFIGYSSAYGISFLFEKFSKRKKLYPKNFFIVLMIIINSLIILTGIAVITNKWAGIFLFKIVSYLSHKTINQGWFGILDAVLGIIIVFCFCCIITLMFSIIKEKIPHKIYQFTLSGKYILIAFLIILLPLSFALYFYIDEINNNQIKLQKSLGVPEVNNLMYEYKSDNIIEGNILTDYYVITVLPGFEGNSKKIFLENENFKILALTPPYTSLMGTIDNNTYGLLISDNYYYDPKFSEEINKKLKSGEFTLIFNEQGVNFLKINK